MKTTIQEIDGSMVAMLEGRLDTAASPETEKNMLPLYDCENQDIIIDCTKLEYISSSGLRIFLSVLKNTRLSAVSLAYLNETYESPVTGLLINT